ncbi:esterase/lipase [Chitinophaga skermanii]|uniref:Esterase/lipase n=2 Tax=Chitinophaga skermanii TaxID=331697 RepID=A0A327QRF3_9BACT|nr:esterase/lipase [Chitinophaga skermanii]
MLKRIFRAFLVLMVVLVIIYFLGPYPAPPQLGGDLPQVPHNLHTLTSYVQQHEHAFKVKKDNEARIEWYNNKEEPTEYVIVYLHGFSASQKEGDPVHHDLAERYGCNLYLSRLNEHGLEGEEALLNMTATGLWNDAKHALAIGKQLGKKVILVGTSTGGTLALLLAAKFPKDVYAVINMSPNVAINQPMVEFANNRWGLTLIQAVKRSKYNENKPVDPLQAQYWQTKYRLEAVTELENLVENAMVPATFHAIHQPILNLYYYKNEQEQDPTVKVSAIKEMHEMLATPANEKRAVAIPNAGAHVMGCSYTSKDIPGVEKAIFSFTDEVLKMPRVN